EQGRVQPLHQAGERLELDDGPAKTLDHLHLDAVEAACPVKEAQGIELHQVHAQNLVSQAARVPNVEGTGIAVLLSGEARPEARAFQGGAHHRVPGRATKLSLNSVGDPEKCQAGPADTFRVSVAPRFSLSLFRALFDRPASRSHRPPRRM